MTQQADCTIFCYQQQMRPCVSQKPLQHVSEQYRWFCSSIALNEMEWSALPGMEGQKLTSWKWGAPETSFWVCSHTAGFQKTLASLCWAYRSEGVTKPVLPLSSSPDQRLCPFQAWCSFMGILITCAWVPALPVSTAGGVEGRGTCFHKGVGRPGPASISSLPENAGGQSTHCCGKRTQGSFLRNLFSFFGNKV